MSEYSYWWFLLNVIEGHNRWVVSGGNPDAITYARPCDATFHHNPHVVLDWVVVVDAMPPVTLLGDYLGTVPAYLAQQMATATTASSVNVYQV